MMRINLCIVIAVLATTLLPPSCDSLKCFSCNSAVDGHDKCKGIKGNTDDKDTDNKDDLKFLIPCDSASAFRHSLYFIFGGGGSVSHHKDRNESNVLGSQDLEDKEYVGVALWGIPEITKHNTKDFMSMYDAWNASYNKDDEMRMEATYKARQSADDNSTYVCQKIDIKIPFPRHNESTAKEETRVVRLCGLRALPAANTNEKCVQNSKSSSNIQIEVCECDGDKCNGVGPPQQSWNPFALLVFIGFLQAVLHVGKLDF